MNENIEYLKLLNQNKIKLFPTTYKLDEKVKCYNYINFEQYANSFYFPKFYTLVNSHTDLLPYRNPSTNVSKDLKDLITKDEIIMLNANKQIILDNIADYEFTNSYEDFLIYKDNYNYLINTTTLSTYTNFTSKEALIDILFKFVIQLTNGAALTKYLLFLQSEIVDNYSISQIINNEYLTDCEKTNNYYMIGLLSFINYFITDDKEVHEIFINTINVDKFLGKMRSFIILSNILEIFHWYLKLNDSDKVLFSKLICRDYYNQETFITNIYEYDAVSGMLTFNEEVLKVINENDNLNRFDLIKNYINKNYSTIGEPNSIVKCDSFLLNLIEFMNIYALNEYAKVIKDFILQKIKEHCTDLEQQISINNLLSCEQGSNSNSNSNNSTFNPNVIIDNSTNSNTKNNKPIDNFNYKDSYYYNVLDLTTEQPTEKDMTLYNAIVQCNKNSLVTFKKKIKNIKTYNQGGKETQLTSGKIDKKSFYKYKTDNHIFCKNTYKQKESDLCFGIILDASGSMSGEGIKNGKTTLISLQEIFKTLKINYSIIAHNSTKYNTSDILVYSHFNTNHNYKLKKSYNLASIQPKGCNCDAGALKYMRDEMLKQPNKDKICLIFNDGLPTNCSDEDLIHEIQLMEKSEIELIGIGIDFPEISKYYKKFANGKNLNDMFNIITDILQEYILKKKDR